jgi:hypothetical protein
MHMVQDDLARLTLYSCGYFTIKICGCKDCVSAWNKSKSDLELEAVFSTLRPQRLFS